jgi:sugar O-acyltransferase (sialic acid O-acetyltransferase NeuD family)
MIRKTSQVLGIFGKGGCGRGIAPLVRWQFPEAQVVFVDDAASSQPCNGFEVLSLSDFAAIPQARIALAVANPARRRHLATRCTAAGIDYFTVTAAQHVVMDDVVVGPGALFSPWTTLTSNIRIGAHFHCNLYSYVEHDCVIGDFVTFAPAVRCNGNVRIGDDAYIGAGALIRQGITIGAGAVVGMGAVVVRDVAPGETVVGNPARLLGKSGG